VEQFRRRFPFTKEFSEADIELIMERYQTSNGDVHFVAIHEDIAEVLTSRPPPAPRSDLVLQPDHTRWENATLNVVKKLQAKIMEKRLRANEFFRDFDPLRKGFCTAGQLKTVLTILKLEKEIDRNDFAVLMHKYTREDGMFCYAMFCRDIDAVFVKPGLEQDPMAPMGMPDASITQAGRRNKQQLSAQRKIKLNQLEEKIRHYILVNRVNVRSVLSDLDVKNTGIISKHQLGRAMGTIGLNLTEDDLTLFSSVYCDRGNHNDINWLDLLKVVDRPVPDEEVAMMQFYGPYQEPMPTKYYENKKVRPMNRLATGSPMLH